MGNSNSSSLKNEEERILVKQEECHQHDGRIPDDASDLQISIDLEMIYEFYSVGFVKVKGDDDDGETLHWPVLQVDPFNVPENIYKKWLKECQNSTVDCKLHLLYKYGVDEFIMNEPSLIIFYEEGVKQGLDLIPDQIFAKLKRGKPLLTIEVCLIQALQQLQVEARKEKLDRMNLWKATRKKPDRWVAKRKRTEDDELKRSKRRSTNAVPSDISVNESKLNTTSQTSSLESYHAPQTLSKKRSKKLDDIKSFMEEENDIAEIVKDRRQTCKQKYEKSVEDESLKKKSKMLDDIDSDIEEEKDIVEKVKERRQLCNHINKKLRLILPRRKVKFSIILSSMKKKRIAWHE